MSDEIFVDYCSKCHHNTPQTFRQLGQLVGDTGVFDLVDEGPYRDSGRKRGKQCLVCGKYFSTVSVEEKLRVIR